MPTTRVCAFASRCKAVPSAWQNPDRAALARCRPHYPNSPAAKPRARVRAFPAYAKQTTHLAQENYAIVDSAVVSVVSVAENIDRPGAFGARAGIVLLPPWKLFSGDSVHTAIGGVHDIFPGDILSVADGPHRQGTTDRSIRKRSHATP